MLFLSCQIHEIWLFPEIDDGEEYKPGTGVCSQECIQSVLTFRVEIFVCLGFMKQTWFNCLIERGAVVGTRLSPRGSPV